MTTDIDPDARPEGWADLLYALHAADMRAETAKRNILAERYEHHRDALATRTVAEMRDLAGQLGITLSRGAARGYTIDEFADHLTAIDPPAAAAIDAHRRTSRLLSSARFVDQAIGNPPDPVVVDGAGELDLLNAADVVEHTAERTLWIEVATLAGRAFGADDDVTIAASAFIAAVRTVERATTDGLVADVADQSEVRTPDATARRRGRAGFALSCRNWLRYEPAGNDGL